VANLPYGVFSEGCGHGGDLAVGCPSDVHVVVDIPLRAVDQPDLRNRPRLQPFLLSQISKGERVARVGIDRGQRTPS